MHDRILFLGTAGDIFVVSKQERIAGGIIIQCGDAQLHLNPGSGAVFSAARERIDMGKTTAIIVTDNTFLHAHDANAVIEIMTLGGFDSKGLLLAAKSAVQGDGTNPPRIFPTAQAAVEKTIILQEEAKIEWNNMQLFSVRIKNSDPSAVGIKIVTPQFSLGYTGKTKWTAKLKEQWKDVEILIVELPLLIETKKEDGFCVEEAQRIIEEIKPQLAVLTGFGIHVLKEDILELTREFHKKTGVQTIAAKEGFCFDPTSYAVKLRQKRLQVFS